VRDVIAGNLWALTSAALEENYHNDLSHSIGGTIISASWKNVEV